MSDAEDPIEPDPGAASVDAGGEAPPDGEGIDLAGMTVEELAAEVRRTVQQRDELRAVLQHTQADFENYRKRVLKQQADAAERAAEALVEQLLPILDACESAIRHSAAEVEPIYAALLGTLEKAGLERIDPGGETFDPNLHEAVMHEPSDDDHAEPVVSDVMRPGYAWKGRVIRPAMVKVRG
jgi:molecular chaperone GrpE